MSDTALPPNGDYGDGWLDDDAGPVVPAYALTGGRTRPARTDLDLVAIVETKLDPTGRGLGSLPHYGLPVLGPEHEAILEMCRSPLSVAELASDLDLALGVVRILLGDLLDYGVIQVRQPASVAQFPNERVLKEVIDGLRAL
jgi:uncharacterized protein DUF742